MYMVQLWRAISTAITQYGKGNTQLTTRIIFARTKTRRPYLSPVLNGKGLSCILPRGRQRNFPTAITLLQFSTFALLKATSPRWSKHGHVTRRRGILAITPPASRLWLSANLSKCPGSYTAPPTGHCSSSLWDGSLSPTTPGPLRLGLCRPPRPSTHKYSKPSEHRSDCPDRAIIAKAGGRLRSPASKKPLSNAKQDAQRNPGSQTATAQGKVAHAQGKSIHNRQWAYWQSTLLEYTCSNVHKAIKGLDKKHGKTGIPDIPGMSTFQGKWDIPRGAFFPANVAIPPPPRANWLPPKLATYGNTFRMITDTEIDSKLATARTDLATGSDGILHLIVRHGHRALPGLLALLSSHLLFYGRFPLAWKRAWCVLILKLGRTDSSILKNLRPISLLSDLVKMFKMIIATRIQGIGRLCGAISEQHFECFRNRSAMDGLILILTTGEE